MNEAKKIKGICDAIENNYSAFRYEWKSNNPGFKIYLAVILSLFPKVRKYFIRKTSTNNGLILSWHQNHTNAIYNIYAPEEHDACLLPKILRINSFRDLKQVVRILNEVIRIQGFSNFFLSLHVIVEYTILKKLINDYNRVIIAGHFDRRTIIISYICRNRRELHLCQHGALQIFKKELSPLHVDRINYNYIFSLNEFKRYIRPNLKKEVFYTYQRKNIDSIFKTATVNQDRNAVVFACQDLNPQKNFIIIESLMNSFNLVYVIPHPREKLRKYNRKFNTISKIKITRDKVLNVRFLITRYSTLGLDYAQVGIEPIFINIEDFKMDFLENSNFKIFSSIQQFNEWIKNENNPAALQ